MPHRKHLLILAAVFGVWWLAVAIAPVDRAAWLLENVLVFAIVGCLFTFHRKLLFSRVSYTLIFLFMCIHQVGAHYTYQQVPNDAWLETLIGRALGERFGWERNHFDRLVHFCYGLLLAYPVRELFLRVVDVHGWLDVTMSTSMSFELREWTTAEIFGGGLGHTYVGSQGDEWDPHKDMALASLGALIAMSVIGFVNWRLRRDFVHDWAESLRVKHKAPLGEDALARMTRSKK